MSRKDFELIARSFRIARKILADVPEATATLDLLSTELAGDLRATNPRFSRERFIAACAGLDSFDSAGRTIKYSERKVFA